MTTAARNTGKTRSIYICDSDSAYLDMLHGYLKERLGLPLAIADFTAAEYLTEKECGEDVLLLIISEEEARGLNFDDFKAVLILEDFSSGDGREAYPKHVRSVSRYTKASEILGAVLKILSECAGMNDLIASQELSADIIAFYSPLGRCLQTNSAIALGQVLGEKAKTLYMNFSPFPEERLSRISGAGNLADLFYYYGCERQSLSVRMRQMTARIGNLEVIAPAPSYLQTADIEAAEWLSFINEICRLSGTDFLILDLSETLPCFMELLMASSRIYTICGNDKHDGAKISSYKKYLALSGNEDILKKTLFMQLPPGVGVPSKLSALQASELGNFFVRSGLVPRKKSREISNKL